MGTRRLYRSTRETRIAGVCGGIAERLDVDPVLVRLGAVALALAVPPIGLLSYAVAWLVMPTEPPPGPVRPTSSEPAPPPPASPVAASTPGPPAAGFGPPRGEWSEPPGAVPPASGPIPRSGLPGGRPRGPAFGGMVLIFIGLLLLMLNLGLFEWGIFRLVRWRYIWPTTMIMLGGWLLVRSVRPGATPMERDHGR